MNEHKTYILERFTPALNMVLMHAAPVLFTRYMGSACRQTAIFIAHEMSQRMPEQKWHVFEGQYRGAPRGVEQPYDHAWVWSSGGIFIDANHRRAHRIWDVDNKNNEYPEQSAFARRWREVARRPLPWKELLDDVEFYTDAPGRLLYETAKRMADSVSAEDLDKHDRLIYERLRPEWMDA